MPRRPTEPRRPAEQRCPSACTASVATTATAATAAMPSPTILTFDAEWRAVDFDVWVDDLQLFLQCDSRDGVSLFDHTSGVSTAPAATADSTVRSQWTTRDAIARLAVRSHLPSAERAHFCQYKTAKSLYDAVVARYSSPATAALSRLMLPYLFPDLAAFATVADLITHLCTSDTRYRAALPTEFCAKNLPPMYITLYYLVTRLPDSLASVRDQFLSLCPTELTVDLLEERLTTAEKSILAVGASRGDRRTPFFEGCSPIPLLPSLASVLLSTSLALRRSGLHLLLVGGAATARARGARVVEGTVGVAVEAVEEAEGVAMEVGVVAGVGASVAAVVVVEAAVAVVEAAAVVVEVAAAVVLVEVQPHSVEALVVASASSSRVPVRPRWPSSFVSGTLGVGGLGNVAIFDLDFDAILAAMYAVTDSAEGDCYLSVSPDPGIEAAALGASAPTAPGTGEFAAPGAGESAAPGAGESALSGTAPTEASHSFFRDSTTLTPLSLPVAVSLADPSRGPVLVHPSTVLPCPAASSGLLSRLHLPSFSTNLVSGADLQDAWVDQLTPGGQRVTHCTCSRTGRHLATFTRRPGSSLYTLTTASPPVIASGQVAASSQVFAAASKSSPASAPCSYRPLSHETLLWHHRLGHPSLPRLRGMASRTLVSGLPRCLPPLPPGPAPTCVPCVEGRQRAAPHSSEFPPTEAPLQTLHMDVWGQARVRGQGHECYFLLNVDVYSRYTTVFPLRSKGDITEVLIDWIRGARRHLRKSFGSDLPVLRVHSDRGGEFSSDLLRAFCRAEGIRQTFTLPASPQQNGIAECRIGMVMDVARTSMIHAAAPHFLWPFAVQYTAHQINLQPCVSLPETTPTLRWTGKVGDASVFRVWGSRAVVRDTSAGKLSSRAVPCGVDFFQTFSPTQKMTTLRLLLHVSAHRDYELHSLDFNTTFLQGSLHEEIWLRRPPGFTGSFPAGTQWSLRRPVYGLRQAPHDLVFATADTEALAHVKSELQKRHTCTDLGELTSYLGLRITRDRAQGTIILTQSHMVQQVLQRFGFTYSSPQSTPLPTGHSLSAPPSDESVEPSGSYPELVGCIMYLMTCTRPDLAYPLSLLARYVAPGRHRKMHWDAAKRVLCYLCSTSGMGLVLGGRARVVFTGHADASWVDDLAMQRSSQGYTFSLGSSSVSWRSTRSSSVLTSSCKVEICAGAMAAQELRWLTYLLTNLGEAPRSPPVLYVDNKAMLALCQEHRLEHRTKHIALRYFLTR
ncbi:unnamed protein product [Closterium sp. NIES-54]